MVFFLLSTTLNTFLCMQVILEEFPQLNVRNNLTLLYFWHTHDNLVFTENGC